MKQDYTTRALTYGSAQIQTRSDEKVNLTDMWRASGSDQSKRPVEWLRLASTVVFIEHLADVGKSHVGDFVEKAKGGSTGGGSTWAHWHLSLAYARYLSPSFHVWCNEVIRREMSAPAPASAPVIASRANVGDNSLAINRLRRAVLRACITAKVSKSRVYGLIRREWGVSRPFALNLAELDDVIRLLEMVEDGTLIIADNAKKRRQLERSARQLVLAGFKIN